MGDVVHMEDFRTKAEVSTFFHNWLEMMEKNEFSCSPYPASLGRENEVFPLSNVGVLVEFLN